MPFSIGDLVVYIGSSPTLLGTVFEVFQVFENDIIWVRTPDMPGVFPARSSDFEHTFPT